MGSFGLGSKLILSVPPIHQVRCQMFYLHSLSLILITLQRSLFYGQVIADSEKSLTFSRSGIGQNQDENPALLGLLSSPHTLRPPEASLPINCLETAWGAQLTAVFQQAKEAPHVLSSCTEDSYCRGHGTRL